MLSKRLVDIPVLIHARFDVLKSSMDETNHRMMILG